MRKITPKSILTLRDPFVIIKDNKIIADQNIYSQDGELLTPTGYPIPKLSSSVFRGIGDKISPSSNSSSICGGIITDNGKAAEVQRTEYLFSDGAANATYGFSMENKTVHYAMTLDGLFPAARWQTSGERAGRFIAHHPNGYIDLTSETTPVLLESARMVNPESSSAVTASGTSSGPIQYPARIIDEIGDTFVHISLNATWTITTPNNNNNVYPVKCTNKDITYTYAVKDPTKSQHPNGLIPIGYEKNRKVLFALRVTGQAAARGTAGASVATTAYVFDPLSTGYDVFTDTNTSGLDVYPSTNTSTTLISSGQTGFKTILCARSIKYEEALASVYVPRLLSQNAVVGTNKVSSLSITRHDFTYATKTWARTLLTLIDPATQLAPEFSEELFSLIGATWPYYSFNENDLVTFYDLSYTLEVNGETYIVVLRVGTHVLQRATPSIQPNSIQYVFRIDKDNPNTAFLINREVMPGFFGLSSELVGSYAGNSDYSNLYVIGLEGVYRLKFDTSLLKYVLDETMINVKAASMVVTDNEDLWIIDGKQRLYNLRMASSDIVRLSFADNTNTEFAEAPYDVEVRLSTVNHLGRRGIRSVELVVEGNAVFKANNRNKITVTTSATDDVTAIVTVKDYGQIFVTPTSVS